MNEMASDESETIDCVDEAPTQYVIPSFSFSGCGFLGVFHVGVAACLRDHTDVVNRKEIKFAGASAGALVASSLLLDIDLGYVSKLLLQLAKDLRERTVGNLEDVLRQNMEEILPEDAHERLRNRMYNSVTMVKGMQGGLVTDFKTRELLIDSLIASSYVPGFIGWMPPTIDSKDIIKYDVEFKALSGLSDVGHNTCASDIERKEGIEKPRANQNPVLEKEVVEEVDVFKVIGSKEDSVKRENSECVWWVCGEDCVSEKSDNDENEMREKLLNEKESYFSFLVRLCFASIKTTKRIVQSMPVASRIVNSLVPEGLGDIDEFIEAVLLELLSDNRVVMDGGFSNNTPTFDVNTITVSPFSGESDICPVDLTGLDICFRLVGQSFHASEDNLFRLNHALNPMEPEVLLQLCEQGYNACLLFLHKKHLLSCKKHLMTRIAISSSPCNVGHAHCKCNLCQKADDQIRASLSCTDCQATKKKALSSVLPKSVQAEFMLAIEANKCRKSKAAVPFLNHVIPLMWWCAEMIYEGTILLADLAIAFKVWVMKVWDHLMWFNAIAMRTLREKKEAIKYLVSSLIRELATSLKSDTRALLRAARQRSCMRATVS